MGSSSAPFGLSTSETEYRRAAFDFFRPDLYDFCVEKGRKLCLTLAGLVPPIKEPSATQLKSWYDISRGARPLPANKQLRTAFRGWNVSKGDFEYVEVSSFGPEAEPAYINWYNVREKVILNYFNWKANDLDDLDEKLFPSEIIWQSYILSGDRIPRFDPASLRLIVRHSIVNISTRRAIWYAGRRSTCLKEDPLSGYVEYTPLDEGFYAVLGSDNGANTMRLLIDHKYELRGRTIEKIIILGGPAVEKRGILTDLKDDFERSRTIFLVLSERRTKEEDTS